MDVLELRDRITAKIGDTAIAGGDIEAAVPTILGRFAENVAASTEPFKRELLRKDFSITVVAGVSNDIGTHLAAAEPLLVSSIPSSFAVDSSGNVLQYLPDRTQLTLTRSNMFIYYTVDKGVFRTRDTNGSLTGLGTTVTLTGSYVPTLANVPAQLEDELVDVAIAYLVETAPNAQV